MWDDEHLDRSLEASTELSVYFAFNLSGGWAILLYFLNVIMYQCPLRLLAKPLHAALLYAGGPVSCTQVSKRVFQG